MRNKRVPVLLIAAVLAFSLIPSSAHAVLPGFDHLKRFGFWSGSVQPMGSIAPQQGWANFTNAIVYDHWNGTTWFSDDPATDPNAAVRAGMQMLVKVPPKDDPHWEQW